MASQALTKTNTKFKVGDWITGHNRIYMRVVTVLDSQMGTMYACLSHKGTTLRWFSQYELAQDGFRVEPPDLAKYQKVQAGDIFRVGDDEDSPYVTVLVRADEAVLLSEIPDKAMAHKVMKLEEMLRTVGQEFGEQLEDIIDPEDRRRLKRMGSQLHASKIAGDWMSVEQLCLMHWHWVED